MNFVDENDEVLISGFGRKGKAKGDIPGVRCTLALSRSREGESDVRSSAVKVVKVSGVGLLALWKEKKVRSVLATCVEQY